MRRSTLIAIGIAAVTAASLVPRSALPGASDELLMTVWGMPFEDRLFEDAYAAGFEARNPGLSVRYRRYPDVTDKYFAWHLRGWGADVMRVRITDYHALVAKGALAPLGDFLDDPEIGLSAAERRDYLPAIWDQLLLDGAIYALPSDNAQFGLYYNKALFDAADLDYPDETWTWSDLRGAAAALTVRGGDGRIEQYGIDFELWAWPFMTLFAQAGGELWDDEGTTTLIDAPAGRAALELMVELLPHASALRTSDARETATGPDKLFATGQTAMLFDGSWRAPDLERSNPDLDFAIAPLPGGQRRAVVSGSVLWAVSAHSRRKEDAWRMITWMTNAEQSLRYWDMLRVAPPARASIIRSEAFRSTSGLIDADGSVIVPPMPEEAFADRGRWLLHAITEDPATGTAPGFVPVAPYQLDLENAVNTMLSRVFATDRSDSLEVILADAAAAVHRIIDRDRSAAGMPAVAR